MILKFDIFIINFLSRKVNLNNIKIKKKRFLKYRLFINDFLNRLKVSKSPLIICGSFYFYVQWQRNISKKSIFLIFDFCVSYYLSCKSIKKLAYTLIFIKIVRATFEKPIIFHFVRFLCRSCIKIEKSGHSKWKWNLANLIGKTTLISYQNFHLGLV